MNEQEVWVRMMAAILSCDTMATTEKVAEWADEAVAEWRKRYGQPAEPEAPAFKVGDRVRLAYDNEKEVGTFVEFWSQSTCLVDFPSVGRTPCRTEALTLDPTPPQR